MNKFDRILIKSTIVLVFMLFINILITTIIEPTTKLPSFFGSMITGLLSSCFTLFIVFFKFRNKDERNLLNKTSSLVSESLNSIRNIRINLRFIRGIVNSNKLEAGDIKKINKLLLNNIDYIKHFCDNLQSILTYLDFNKLDYNKNHHDLLKYISNYTKIVFRHNVKIRNNIKFKNDLSKKFIIKQIDKSNKYSDKIIDLVKKKLINILVSYIKYISKHQL